MRMPFGRYKGQELASIDVGYLHWLLSNCDLREPLKKAVKAELDRREWNQSDPLQSSTITTDVVNVWHRRMAVKFHPDKGGSHAAMVAVNAGRDLLMQLMQEAAQ